MMRCDTIRSLHAVEYLIFLHLIYPLVPGLVLFRSKCRYCISHNCLKRAVAPGPASKPAPRRAYLIGEPLVVVHLLLPPHGKAGTCLVPVLGMRQKKKERTTNKSRHAASRQPWHAERRAGRARSRRRRKVARGASRMRKLQKRETGKQQNTPVFSPSCVQAGIPAGNCRPEPAHLT